MAFERLTETLSDGDSITVAHVGYSEDNRWTYRYEIHTREGMITRAEDLHSGANGMGASPEEMLETLIAFLMACVESYRYAGEDGENVSLFPAAVREWADAHEDELQTLEITLRGWDGE